MVVGVSKQVGKGRVYYLGNSLGGSIFAGCDAGIELHRALIPPVARPRVTSLDLRPRLIEGPTRSLITVFNDRTQDQKGAIEIPIPLRHALDVHTLQEITAEKNVFNVEIPHQDVKVILLD
jgi:hypothetical protein